MPSRATFWAPAASDRRFRGPMAAWLRDAHRAALLLLALGLAITVTAKARATAGMPPESRALESAIAVRPDAAFFLCTAAALAVIRATFRGAWVARGCLMFAAAVTAWAVLNACWLMVSGAQLQPEVAGMAMSDPANLWPAMRGYLAARPVRTAAMCAGALGITCFVGWSLSGSPTAAPSSAAARRVVTWMAVAGAAVLAAAAGPRSGSDSYSCQAIGFSCHVAAARWLLNVGQDRRPAALDRADRHVARGQRDMGPPPGKERLNVAIVLLESVSRSATSLGGGASELSPTLDRLAREGTEVTSTYAIVPQTNKAIFAIMTGCTPDITPDFAEAALRSTPVESLATILGRNGYRSAHFQASDGYFGAMPSLLDGLGVGHCSFLETTGNESARLGYLSADDMAMLPPIFEWIGSDDEPFLLTAITSVSHTPYSVPRDRPQFPPDSPEAYGEAVRYGDAVVARLLTGLEERGLLDRTLVCVIGDHGESFRTGGWPTRWFPFEEVIRVPCVFRLPGRVPAGSRIDGPRSQLDVAPTVLEILGWDVSTAGFEGSSMLAPAEEDRRLYFDCWYVGSPRGWVAGSSKVVYWPHTDTVVRFDLARDPREERPEALPPDEARAAKDALAKWAKNNDSVISPSYWAERTLYGRWRALTAGRKTWTSIEPGPAHRTGTAR